jgi:hypothetical protein
MILFSQITKPSGYWAWFLYFGVYLVSQVATAQNLSNAQVSARRDLDTSIKRLANTRETIATEKVQLSSLVNEAKEKASIKRRELERLQSLQDNANLSLEKLKEENEKLEKDLLYVSSLFRDYGQEFDVNLDIAEKPVFQPDLDALQSSRTAESAGPTLASQTAEIRFLQTALTRLHRIIGGHEFRSKSMLNPEGQVVSGTCLLVGPFSFFSSEDGESGLVDPHYAPDYSPYNLHNPKPLIASF